MQDLASEFAKHFPDEARTLTAGGGDPLPHPTPSPVYDRAGGGAWDPNLGPLNFSAVVAPLQA